jgi:hypothetical protein
MSFLTDMFGSTKVSPASVSAPPPVTPPGFRAGGLAVNWGDNGYNVGASDARTSAVGNLADTFGALGNQYGTLASSVAPGFNDLLKTRLTDLGNQATAAIGDLKQNLQSRRILGSSFGQDTINRLNTGINQQRDAVIADNYLKSLQAQKELIGQQYQAYAQKFQTGLDELNLEASTASGLMGSAAGILQQNQSLLEKANEFNAGSINSAAQFNAKMSNDQASGFGSFLGKFLPLPSSGGGNLGFVPGLGNFKAGL